MIVTIAEHFTSDPSDRERSPTIIWKPGYKNKIRIKRLFYKKKTISKINEEQLDLISTSTLNGFDVVTETGLESSADSSHENGMV